MTDPCADGATYEHDRDHSRLEAQRLRVIRVMRDHEWHNLYEISDQTGDPVQSVSARIRDFRKAKFGGRQITRRYVSNGLWEYKLEVPDAVPV